MVYVAKLALLGVGASTANHHKPAMLASEVQLCCASQMQCGPMCCWQENSNGTAKDIDLTVPTVKFKCSRRKINKLQGISAGGAIANKTEGKLSEKR